MPDRSLLQTDRLLSGLYWKWSSMKIPLTSKLSENWSWGMVKLLKLCWPREQDRDANSIFRNRKLGLNQTRLSIYFKSIAVMLMVDAGSRFCVPLTIIIPLLTITDLRDAFSPSKLERTRADSSYKAAEFPLLSKMNQPVSSLASLG